MATFKPILPVIDNFLVEGPSADVIELTSYASKFMRYKTLLDRENRGYQKVDRDGPIGAFESDGITRTNTGTLENYKQEAIELGYTYEKAGVRQSAIITSGMTDRISIIDIDSVPLGNGTNGLRSKRQTYDYVELPFVPRELNYSMSSKFVGIATLGRNNPYYQFTGSEDTLTFEIDWFSEQNDRKDVINNCRWIESLTKANAYDNPPHRIMLSWGMDNLLWQDDIWICVDAGYSLTDFVRGYRKIKAYKEPNPRGEFISTNMLPQQALQRVVLKRISSLNLSSERIKKRLS